MLHDDGIHHEPDNCPRCEDEESMYENLEPYNFIERPVAKSSTSVMKATVCQRCGCKLDGKTLVRPCDCNCHRNGPRVR